MLILTFTAGANRYAVDVGRIVELVPRVELRKVPHAPACLAGLLGYRGKIVPVIDLGILLDANPCRDRLSTRIILVDDSARRHDPAAQAPGASHDDHGSTGAPPEQDHSSSLLGMIAEGVSDLTYTQPDQTAAVSVYLPHAPYLGSLIQTDQGIVQLIVVEKVREASLRSAGSG